MKFKLRPWAGTDVRSLVKFANNWNVAKNLTDKFTHPYTEIDGAAFIEFVQLANPVNIFAIEVNGEACGGIGLHPQTDIYRKNMELGYWLAEPFWGKGIITGAIKETVDYAFETFDVERVFARPFDTNLGSKTVLEKNGFVLEGHFNNTLIKNGEYLGELIYAVRKKDWYR